MDFLLASVDNFFYRNAKIELMKNGFSKVLIIAIIAVVLAVGAGIGYWLGKGGAKTSGNENGQQPLASQKTDQDYQSDAPYVGDDFTLIPPVGWIRTQISGVLVAYQNSKETHPKGSAAEKVNFKSYFAVSFDKTNGQTLNEIVELVKNQTKGVAPAISFDSVLDGTIGGQPAKVLEASLLMQNINFKVVIAVAMKGDKYFTISNNTTAEKWPEYQDIFYNVLNSFNFKY